MRVDGLDGKRRRPATDAIARKSASPTSMRWAAPRERVDRAHEVDVDHLVDMRLGELEKRAVGADAGVRDEDVEPAEAFGVSATRRRVLRRVANVGGPGDDRRSAEVVAPLREPSPRFTPSAVSARATAAPSAARPGDHRHVAFQHTHASTLTGMHRVLVANRGEIALRIFRACAAEGWRPSRSPLPTTAGRCMPTRRTHVEISSYLVPGELVRAALEAGADAVHSGYGFLAESAELAEAVLKAGPTWVGPPPAALRAGGDKLAAKERPVRTACRYCERDAGRDRVSAGSQGGGGRRRARHARRAGRGGAGRGARGRAARGGGRLRRRLGVLRALPRASAPRRDPAPRRPHGAVAALGERDCSIQRRHQKVLEESPSPALGPELRAAMSEAAVASLARSATRVREPQRPCSMATSSCSSS